MTAATLEGSDVAVSSRPSYLMLRLSALIFIAFAIMGTWVPVFSLHLRNLRFSAEATAWASATGALGSLFAPLIWGQIADRWLAMQRCISLCALGSGVGLILIPHLADPERPWILVAGCLGVWFFLIPTVGLISSLIFRQLEHPERDYGKIRVWGTLGWIVIGWCLSLWYFFAPERELSASIFVNFADSIHMGALAALVLFVYALTLPDTPPNRNAQSSSVGWFARLADAPLAALQLFRERSFTIYCATFFGLYVTIPFTAQLNPLLLTELGIGEKDLPTYLTISQSTEVAFMLLLPVLLGRVGAKTTMVFGIAVWMCGLTALGSYLPLGLVLTALLAHGTFICCFLVAGQVFVNRLAAHSIRASAQAILLFISGSALLLGHLGVGWIRDWTNDNYRFVYLVGAALSLGMLLLFLLGFTPPTARGNSSEEPLVPPPEMT